MAARSRKTAGQPTDAAPTPRKGTRKKRSQPETQAPPDIGELIGQELSRRFTEAIEPVLAGAPDQIMTALEPAVRQLREGMAHVVQERAQEALQLDPIPARSQRGGADRDETVSTRSDRQSPASESQNDATPPPASAEAHDRGEAQMEDATNEREGDTAVTAEPQTEERQSNATNEDGGATGETTQEQPRAQTRQRAQQPADATARGSYAFDASGAVRVALLNLAHTMKEKGAIYQAINAYERILIRYPGTGAANAAVQELVELAGQLQRDGKIYTALNILTKLEENIG